MIGKIGNMALTPTLSRRTGREGKRGFTLIEVLVTLLLIGMVIPALMHVISAAGAAGRDAADRNQAAELAKSQLAQVLAQTQLQTNSNNNLSGDFSPDFPQYQWSATVQPWTQDTSGMGINEIDLKVTWKGRRAEQSVELSTLAYQRTQESN
jgi:prepilin-type N-terminal cleavage/methylation domain-containing protein